MGQKLSVTFDSNVLQRVLRPDEEFMVGAPSIADQRIVHEVLANGLIEGFVAKTFFTKEAISKKVREDIFRLNYGRYNNIQSSFHRTGSPYISTMVSYNKVNEQENFTTFSRHLSKREILHLMRKFNVRILHTFLLGDISTKPRNVEGDFRTDDIQPSDYYKSDKSDAYISVRNDKCFRFIQEKLGAGVLSVDWIDSKDGKRTPDQANHDLRFKNPSAEESDIQAISTHYAHEIDIFCTEDKGKGAGELSVMRPENKGELEKCFGIRFCTLHELADLIRQQEV